MVPQTKKEHFQEKIFHGKITALTLLYLKYKLATQIEVVIGGVRDLPTRVIRTRVTRVITQPVQMDSNGEEALLRRGQAQSSGQWPRPGAGGEEQDNLDKSSGRGMLRNKNWSKASNTAKS